MPKFDLRDLSLSQLRERLSSWGEPSYRADQIYNWLYRHLALSVGEMTNLPASLRQQLAKETELGTVQVDRRQCSSDKRAVKLLFSLVDGQAVEGVLLKYRQWYSACISSQAGCRMGCAFCASTLGGLARNLTPGEMMGELVLLAREARALGGEIRSLVLMGTGEPLDNYDNVLTFLAEATQPAGLGLSYRRVTLSTCGLISGMRRLAKEGLPLTLAVSLHAPTDALRSELMPINKVYPLPELMAACSEYIMATGRRITFEYALLAGVNDNPKQAHQLAKLLQGMLCHVNLIPFNPVSELSFGRPQSDRVELFYRTLEKEGISVTIRRELGTDISAACGQLRRQVLSKEETPS
ncbi:MAG: 23S rRNA (adenine(2503)-C(2))-methyltransferase RlmN [bacterium]|jgi:23S rRNA (adenine2503-C2)-methyltransferase